MLLNQSFWWHYLTYRRLGIQTNTGYNLFYALLPLRTDIAQPRATDRGIPVSTDLPQAKRTFRSLRDPPDRRQWTCVGRRLSSSAATSTPSLWYRCNLISLRLLYGRKFLHSHGDLSLGLTN